MPGFLGNLIRKNLQTAPAREPSEPLWVQPRLRSWFEADSLAADPGFGPSTVEQDAAEESASPATVEASLSPQRPEPPASGRRAYVLDLAPRSQSPPAQRTPQPAPASPASTASTATPATPSRPVQGTPPSLPSIAPVAVQRSPVEPNVASPHPSARTVSPVDRRSGGADTPTPVADTAPVPTRPQIEKPPRPSIGGPRMPTPGAPVPGSLADQDGFASLGTGPGSPLSPEQPAPTIRVTIGRVEVRAIQAGGSAPAAATSPAKSQPVGSRTIPALSLADYLKRRSYTRSRTGR